MASTQSYSLRAAPVQSVQELIKEPIPAVPQPFILDDPPASNSLSQQYSPATTPHH
ncbi:hypothetical protein CK203_062692 [Vitis vinifera]|uniref:Uncharacterized protein n=1 Tax=Vitis vinifera TaxID=29760 RepID=A0A438GGD8_VITVI|nr:hypothetical protein CK203_062692 [Vitis vinifera]